MPEGRTAAKIAHLIHTKSSGNCHLSLDGLTESKLSLAADDRLNGHIATGPQEAMTRDPSLFEVARSPDSIRGGGWIWVLNT